MPPADGHRTVTVTEGADGDRADVVLADHLDETRSRAAARCARGEVTIDGSPIAKGRRLRVGEVLTVAVTDDAPAPAEPAAVPGVAIRHHDDHLAVVAKPAGLVVHPGAGTRGPTLVDALRAHGLALADLGQPERPGIVHRLDRGTSGLLVVALSVEAGEGLAAAFRTHAVHRRYLALTDGVPEHPAATIEAAIARHPGDRTRFAVDPSGRHAVSHYDVLADHGRVAEVGVSLETGRTHQVRVHLAAIRHPVCGDMAYGADPDTADVLGLERPALHAAELGFDHPVTGERIHLAEDPPRDLQRALDTARAHTDRLSTSRP